MSDALSAPQAIKATYTIDTIVHRQDRFLPLQMDREYQAAYSKLKKLQKQQDSRTELEGDIVIELDSDEECASIEGDVVSSKTQVEKLKSLVESKKKKAKDNSTNTLPDPHTARRNHHPMSVFVEGRIAEEMLQNEGSFIIPDGTTRNKVGEIAAMLIKVGNKMRAVKAQQIGKGDRVTWADTIIHTLSRLAYVHPLAWSSLEQIRALHHICRASWLQKRGSYDTRK